MPLRVGVDRHKCIGAGNCITIAPTAFDWLRGDFAKADVVDADSVEDELLREAAFACPTVAIWIEDVAELLPWQLRGKVEPPRRVLKTFMFTDVVGSTNLVEVMGDEAWDTLLRWHDTTLREVFTAHLGKEISTTGDGFFVGFDSPEQAVSAAVAIQRRLAEHRQKAGFAPPIRTCGAKPCCWRCSWSRRWIAIAAATACSGESKLTKKPSPVVEISLPWWAPKTSRSAPSCQRRRVSHASSPSASTRLVEPTTSVNMNVFRTRRAGSTLPRSCHGRSSVTSSTTTAPVGQANAASRSSSSSTLSGSATSAFPKSPWSQSKAVGASVMQFPAPMHLWRSIRTRSAISG